MDFRMWDRNCPLLRRSRALISVYRLIFWIKRGLSLQDFCDGTFEYQTLIYELLLKVMRPWLISRKHFCIAIVHILMGQWPCDSPFKKLKRIVCTTTERTMHLSTSKLEIFASNWTNANNDVKYIIIHAKVHPSKCINHHHKI